MLGKELGRHGRDCPLFGSGHKLTSYRWSSRVEVYARRAEPRESGGFEETSATKAVAVRRRLLPQPKPPYHSVGLCD